MQTGEGMEPAGLWRSILAAAAGNVLEWYDFTVYAYMAPYIAEKFFPQDDPLTGLLAVFATFGLGFVIRPLGGILIGRFGDLKGRKAALIFTILLMAMGTAGIGLVPGRDQIGGLAPFLSGKVRVWRSLQGTSRRTRQTRALSGVLPQAFPGFENHATDHPPSGSTGLFRCALREASLLTRPASGSHDVLRLPRSSQGCGHPWPLPAYVSLRSG